MLFYSYFFNSLKLVFTIYNKISQNTPFTIPLLAYTFELHKEYVL